jgi:hypothetical protein
VTVGETSIVWAHAPVGWALCDATMAISLATSPSVTNWRLYARSKSPLQTSDFAADRLSGRGTPVTARPYRRARRAFWTLVVVAVLLTGALGRCCKRRRARGPVSGSPCSVCSSSPPWGLPPDCCSRSPAGCRPGGRPADDRLDGPALIRPSTPATSPTGIGTPRLDAPPPRSTIRGVLAGCLLALSVGG